MQKLLGAFAVAALTLVVASSVNAATFTRDLTIGSTGSDVVALQDMLIASGDLVLPAGVSKGYFGALTKSSLAKWQAKMSISPAAGYFGPVTRAKAEGSKTSTGSNDDSSSTGLKGGDGDFKSFDVLGTPSSEDVYEGDSVEVLGFEFEADDSDLQVERVEIKASSTNSNVTKPWKVLETVALLNGSKEVASVDASDSDNWDETSNGSDEYTLKMSGFKSVVKEGSVAKFYVEVTAKDTLDTDELGSWDISLSATDAVRATNAEGITVEDGDTSVKLFTLKEAEAGDVSVTVDDADNKDQSVTVDDDSNTTDVFAYLAKVKSKTGDNMVETVTVDLTSPSSESLSDMIDTVYLFIDGEEVGSESAASSVVFDDLENVIDEGDKIDFEVKFDLNDTNDGARYQNADSIKVDGITVDYVDSNDDDKTVTSSTDGGVLTLSTSSISVELSGSATAKQIGADETKGAFAVSFEVTAPEDEDIYIAKAGSSAFTHDVINASSGATTTATTSSVTLAKNSGGSTSGSYYLISSGSTATFTATVNLSNAGGSDRSLRVGLKSVVYKIGSTGASPQSYTSGIDEDYETPDLQLFAVDAQ